MYIYEYIYIYIDVVVYTGLSLKELGMRGYDGDIRKPRSCNA